MYKRNLKNMSKRSRDIQERSVVIIPKIFTNIRNFCVEYKKPIRINFSINLNYDLQPACSINVFRNII